MALNQTGLPNERKLAFIDRNHDLYLTSVRKFGGSLVPGKLGVMVQSMLWAADCPMLAAMQETRFTIWYYPAIIYVDKALLGQTLVERDTAEFGKHPVITSFLKNSISVRRAEASHHMERDIFRNNLRQIVGLPCNCGGLPLPIYPAWLRFLWTLGRRHKTLQVSP